MKTLKSLINLHSIYLIIQKRLFPPQIIAISFIMVIMTGAFLLYLPISHQPDIEVSAIDAFFTSTSAVCVTGLVTLTTATTWSTFGKIVILCLIQIGGLSLITIFTYFLVHLGKKVTLKDRLTVQTAFNVNDLSGMVRMVMLVIRGTLICEGVGAILLTGFFINENMVWYEALFYGIFHSVSAFCNAGFDLIGKTGLEPYSSSILLNFVIMSLIILGGIGFSVWRDIIVKIHYKIMPHLKSRITLSLHSKLAIITTIVLIIIGTLYFFISEYQNPGTLGQLSVPNKLLASLFQSVTLRTAGFATIAQDGLKESSKLVSSIFMLVGGSPGGTAGGIKTVTIAIILCSVWSTIKGHNKIIIFERTISANVLQKSLTVAIIILFFWLGGTTILSFVERMSVFPHTYVDLLFEVASALGTVGLSTGITPFLTTFGKIIIIFCMFIGRIGPIVIILSLSHRSNLVNERIQFPNEDVMIG